MTNQTSRYVALHPLDDAEYAAFAEQQVREYARQQVLAGEWPESEALERARTSEHELVTDALRDHGHTFFKGVAADPAADLVDGTTKTVGWLWVGPIPSVVTGIAGIAGIAEPTRARWLYQITVAESERGRGFGTHLLAALEAHLYAHGATDLYLRVFNWNTVARRLYDRAGYEPVLTNDVDTRMRKRLA